MPNPTLRYDKMVEDALRSVVREALTVVAQRGLPGAHHFYITFRTDMAGVAIPDFLRAQYPTEMTIVLQHQFWDLDITERQFSVTLSFHSQAQRLTIPFSAITAFADPSVKFGLEFQAHPAAAEAPPMVAESPRASREEAPSGPADVVRLDAFRKK
jgi:hypothetical protein